MAEGGALRELLAFLGVEVDTSQLEGAHKQIEGFIPTLKTLGGVIAEAFAFDKVKEFVREQVELGDRIGDTSEMLGLSARQLQAYTLVTEEAGGSATAMTTGLRFLNRNLGAAAEGGGEAAKIFKDLGISFKDSSGKTREAGDVMADLADKIAATEDHSKKTRVAMALLGRGGAELIPTLNQGGDAFRNAYTEMDKLGGGLSKDFIDAAQKAQAENVRLAFSWSGLKSELGLALFPALDTLVTWMTKLVVGVREFTKHTYVLQTGLTALGVVAGLKTVSSITALAKTIGLLKPTIGETVAAFGRFLVPIAIVALLYLAFDELYTFIQGGDSIIGRIIDHFFGLGTAAAFARELRDQFREIVPAVEDVGDMVKASISGSIDYALIRAKGLAKILKDLATGSPGQASQDIEDMNKETDALQQRFRRRVQGDADDVKERRARMQARGEAGDVELSLIRNGVPPEVARNIADQTRVQALAGAATPGGALFTGPDAPGPAGPDTPSMHVLDADRTRKMRDRGTGAFVPAPRAFAPPATGTVINVPVPVAGGVGAPGASTVPPIVIHQTNHFDTKVDASGNSKPGEVGEAVAGGQSTAVQRANANTLKAQRRP